jgi:hypothetical protein
MQSPQELVQELLNNFNVWFIHRVSDEYCERYVPEGETSTDEFESWFHDKVRDDIYLYVHSLEGPSDMTKISYVNILYIKVDTADLMSDVDAVREAREDSAQ